MKLVSVRVTVPGCVVKDPGVYLVKPVRLDRWLFTADRSLLKRPLFECKVVIPAIAPIILRGACRESSALIPIMNYA